MKGMRVFRGAPVLLALLAVVCLAEAHADSRAGRGPDVPSDAVACPVPVAKTALRNFIRTYNQGDTESLDGLFTERREFMWYSAGPPGERTGSRSGRPGLLRYFEARHRLHDRLHLRRFGRVGKGHGVPYFESATHFGILLSRRVDGFNGGRWFRMTGSKGALVCERGVPKIFVMSLGGPPWGRR